MNDVQHTAKNNDILHNLAHDYLKEKKRKRRWNIFFRSLLVILFLVILYTLFFGKKSPVDDQIEHAALIDINGPIFDMANSNADDIARSLRRAFEASGSHGIILRINSPGGSPVEADYIFNEIMRLREKHPETPVYAVCTEACVSAAYYIASAADEIYANPNSLVGSIGVLFNGFGFTEALEKLGVERRLITAGQYKGFMDPFLPINTTEEAHLQQMLDSIHERFEQQILLGRGDRLNNDDPDIFSGLFWTGNEAQNLGLIDGFGSAGYIAREVIGTEDIINYTMQPNYFERLMRELSISVTGEMADRIGLRAQSIQS